MAHAFELPAKEQELREAVAISILRCGYAPPSRVPAPWRRSLCEGERSPLTVAVLGGEVQLQTVTGDTISVRVPPETQNGQVLRLRGLGMPSTKGGKRGDLMVKVNVVLPSNLTEQERESSENLND